MKHDRFFKLNFDAQNKISTSYDREARKYQAAHNKNHPGLHIWRHILYARTFYFLYRDIPVSIRIEIVRFRYAGSNRTFTFYGSLFRAFSHFPSSFVRQAIDEKYKEGLRCGEASSIVHPSTLWRWAKSMVQGASSPAVPACQTT